MHLIVWAFFYSNAASATSPPALTLDAAYFAALKNTQAMPLEEARLRQTQAQVDQARGRALPEVSLKGRYARQQNPGSLSTFNDQGRTEQSTLALNLIQPLYQGGRLVAGRQLSRALLDAKEYDVLAVRSQLYFAVAQDFYSVKLAESEKKNIETAIGLTRERIAELEKRKKIGRSRPGEVLTAQAQLSILQSQLEAVHADLSNALERFRLRSGLSTEVTAESLTHARDAPIPLPEKLEFYLQHARSRPDLASLQSKISAAQSGVDIARAGHFPTLGFFGNGYLYRTGNLRDVRWDLGLELTLPLFQGGLISAQVKEASAVVQERDLSLEARRRESEVEVRAAFQDLTSALRRLKDLSSALHAAQKGYQEQARDYRLSLVTTLEVLQAQNTLQETRRALDQTHYQAWMAWAALRAASSLAPERNAP